MAGIINIGVSALNAFKRQMETTGHNIANVNTEGYSRQVVQLDARSPQISAQGYIGSGVEVASIRRSYDSYLATRVRDYTSSYEEFAVFEQRARQIDNVLADSAAGIDDTLQQFFASVNDVADDPTSIPARSVMLNRASQLADRFNALDGWLEDIRHQLNGDLEREVGEINALAQSLASVNTRIGALNGTPGGIPNDILDERDKLIDDLSKFTNVSTLEQSDGSMNVFVGTGQALVVGGNYNTLAVTNNTQAADHKELVIRQSGGLTVNVTQQMTGGSLGGLLRFRDEVLDESQNALGRVAIGIASFFNAEHATGMDLDGQLGGDFFSTASPQVLADPGNSGSIVVGFDDPADLTTHEYELVYTGGSWSMTDLDSGASVALSGTGTALDPLVADGMSIVVNAASNGDTYRLRPTRAGASSLGLLVTNERDIAAAEAVRTQDLSGNTGTGHIGAGAQTSSSGTSLPATPITLTFDGTLNQFTVSTGGTLAYDPASDTGSTLTVNIAGLGDFSFTMTGTPADGDQFQLSSNAGGVGDNRNARRLADLQSAKMMIGGTASFANTYGALIADVGTKTNQAAGNVSVQSHLLSQAEAAKSEVSGVNLDEEAADLVRFQQAYQAAAQVISVANTLFDSLLSAVRR
ncbi:MAG: flagellar hook-associated protein FlgK [Sedimenticolaceae bacterium]